MASLCPSLFSKRRNTVKVEETFSQVILDISLLTQNTVTNRLFFFWRYLQQSFEMYLDASVYQKHSCSGIYSVPEGFSTLGNSFPSDISSPFWREFVARGSFDLAQLIFQGSYSYSVSKSTSVVGESIFMSLFLLVAPTYKQASLPGSLSLKAIPCVPEAYWTWQYMEKDTDDGV